DREQAIVVTSTVSQFGDSYCSLAWGSKLAKLADAETAGGIIAGEVPEELSAREAALCAWCRTVVRDPMTTTAEQVDALRAAGFDDREIFEATLLLSLRLAFSTVNDSLGAEPDRRHGRVLDGRRNEDRAAGKLGRVRRQRHRLGREPHRLALDEHRLGRRGDIADAVRGDHVPLELDRPRRDAG